MSSKVINSVVQHSFKKIEKALKRQLPENGINELEMVTNNTLSGVISQLSDLSRHAEDIFGELTNEAHQFNDRCRVLGERITSLNSRISLDVKRKG